MWSHIALSCDHACDVYGSCDGHMLLMYNYESHYVQKDRCTTEEGGHVSRDLCCRLCTIRLSYGDLRINPIRCGNLPRCNHLGEHIIRKPSSSRFQISTHLNPIPMSLSQYSALNGVYIVTEASLCSLLNFSASQTAFLDIFKASAGTPTFLTFCCSRIYYALGARVRFTVCLTHGWRSMAGKRSLVKPYLVDDEAVGR